MIGDPFQSGIPAVDELTGGLALGDNLVWRVRDLELYRTVCRASVERARQDRGWPSYYFRLANHEPLLEPQDGLRIVDTQPEMGFEHFISQVHRTISAQGIGGVYIFDSLSDLHETCYSDRMIGLFFHLTCPYLRRMETIAHFCVYWGVHSAPALDPIRRTTQIWFDVYDRGTDWYLQMLKSNEDPGGDPNRERHLRLYRIAGPFSPPSRVHSSVLESAVRRTVFWSGIPSSPQRQLDVWDQFFLRFESVVKMIEEKREAGLEPSEDLAAQHDHLRDLSIRMILTNEPRMYRLVQDAVSSRKILEVWRRMIGTGYIGGKAVGMIVAREMLRNAQARICPHLEEHDSFYIGTDVFYSYLVDNDCWWDRQDQLSHERMYRQSRSLQEKILAGSFSENVLAGFRDILEYFGDAPIIVRSSSLLEDNYGNAFAGKYESFFCSNGGSEVDRMEAFCTAVRRIYAGTMSEEALEYRRARGVLDKDEQMALLVQRVCGRPRGGYFFPDLAGTGVSYNAYSWHGDIDPEAGMARFVIGLGTRAVDRVADDFPWVVSLNAPLRNLDRETRRPRQRQLDAVDQSVTAVQAVRALPVTGTNAQDLSIPALLFERDWRRERQAVQYGFDPRSVLEPSLNQVFLTTDLVPLLRETAEILRRGYGTQVEFEFAVQWDSDPSESSPPGPDAAGRAPVSSGGGRFWISVLQCRPFQMIIDPSVPVEPKGISESDIVLRVHSPVIGRGRHIPVHAIVWVDPAGYAALGEEDQHRTARQVGELLRSISGERTNVVLLGPGRWGTGTCAMGVPVHFREIRTVKVLAEMDWMHADLNPDISLGTHFFHDLVEADILFLGIRRSDPDLVFRLGELDAVKRTYGDTGCIRYAAVPADAAADDPVLFRFYADPAKHIAMLYRASPDSADE